ncbi:MAG: phytoene/squalene synthase family protein [Actinomycetota bacterium]|nr:phytoene/squalene synthase family protein [Actinomycetota bacterium]
MKDEKDALALSYERCKELNKRFGKSYYYSTYLLPKSSRKYIHSLYAFCRYADDIVDDFDPSDLASRKERLKKFSDDFYHDLKVGQSSDPILRAVIHTVKLFDIEVELFDKFLHSMEMDFSKTRYETYDELLGYMEGSAAVIGEMTLPVLEPSSKYAREPARQLGFAFQLTNFIRDVEEDLKRNRIYLPLSDVEKFDALEDLLLNKNSERVRDLISFEIDRAREHYLQSLAGDCYLPPRSAACVQAARDLYSGILQEVEKSNYQIFGHRATVSMYRKLKTAARTVVI